MNPCVLGKLGRHESGQEMKKAPRSTEVERGAWGFEIQSAMPISSNLQKQIDGPE